MNKTDTVSIRMEPVLKDGSEKILKELGLTASQAITLFYKQVLLQKGLPFKVMLPNATTQKAIEDATLGRDLATYDTADELFKDLGI